MSTDIYVTNIDRERITKLLEKTIEDSNTPDDSLKRLAEELNRVIVVEPRRISQDVITMNTKALIKLNDEEVEISLVYPEEADLSEMRLSIFSPIGTAILGQRQGSTIEWEVPSGTSKIHIEKILYQPEAAGHYNL